MASREVFDGLVRQLESHAADSEIASNKICERIGAISKLLGAAEDRHGKSVESLNKAEAKVFEQSQQHSKTKRKLAILYSKLALTCSSSNSFNKKSPKTRRSHEINEVDGVISAHVLWSLLLHKSMFTLRPTKHLLGIAKHTVRSIMCQSLDDTLGFYNLPLCQYGLLGVCTDQHCPFRHQSEPTPVLASNDTDSVLSSLSNMYLSSIGKNIPVRTDLTEQYACTEPTNLLRKPKHILNPELRDAVAAILGPSGRLLISRNQSVSTSVLEKSVGHFPAEASNISETDLVLSIRNRLDDSEEFRSSQATWEVYSRILDAFRKTSDKENAGLSVHYRFLLTKLSSAFPSSMKLSFISSGEHREESATGGDRRTPPCLTLSSSLSTLERLPATTSIHLLCDYLGIQHLFAAAGSVKDAMTLKQLQMSRDWAWVTLLLLFISGECRARCLLDSDDSLFYYSVEDTIKSMGRLHQLFEVSAEIKATIIAVLNTLLGELYISTTTFATSPPLVRQAVWWSVGVLWRSCGEPALIVHPKIACDASCNHLLQPFVRIPFIFPNNTSIDSDNNNNTTEEAVICSDSQSAESVSEDPLVAIDRLLFVRSTTRSLLRTVPFCGLQCDRVSPSNFTSIDRLLAAARADPVLVPRLVAQWMRVGWEAVFLLKDVIGVENILLNCCSRNISWAIVFRLTLASVEGFLSTEGADSALCLLVFKMIHSIVEARRRNRPPRNELYVVGPIDELHIIECALTAADSAGILMFQPLTFAIESLSPCIPGCPDFICNYLLSRLQNASNKAPSHRRVLVAQLLATSRLMTSSAHLISMSAATLLKLGLLMLQTEHFNCVSLAITALETLAKKRHADFMSYLALRVAAEGERCGELPTWIKSTDLPLIEGDNVKEMDLQVVAAYYRSLRRCQLGESVADLRGIPCTDAGEFPFISLGVIADTVPSLLMSGIGLQRFPNCLSGFPALTSLDLSQNSLSELPLDLADICPSIAKLDLSNNRFKMFPSCILEMKKLEELNLSYNLLEYIPTTLSVVTSLRALDVSHNMLKTMISTAATTNLHYVKCDENPFLQRQNAVLN